MRFPWLRTDISWADVVVDTRLMRADEERPEPAPDANTLWAPQELPDRFATNGFYLGNHSVSAYAVQDPTDETCTLSLVRIVGDDGHRIGFIFGPERPEGRFAFDTVEDWLPWLGLSLRPRSTTRNWTLDRDVLRSLTTDAMGHLRSFLDDPTGWDPDLTTYSREGLQWAFSWASTGATYDDAAYLDGGGTRIITGSPQHSSLLGWATGGYTDTARIADWLQSGVPRPRDADIATEYGVTPQMAKEWSIVLPAVACSEHILGFDNAGWTPEAVAEMVLQARNTSLHSAQRNVYGQARLWLRLMTPQRASEYLLAGFTPREAEAAEFPQDGSPVPTSQQLKFLAAFRNQDARSISFFSPPMGEKFNPVFGAVASRQPTPGAAMSRMGTATKTATPVQADARPEPVQTPPDTPHPTALVPTGAGGLLMVNLDAAVAGLRGTAAPRGGPQ